MLEFMSINKTGAQWATSAVSAGGALPTDSSGAPARFVRIAVTTDTWVRIGTGAQTAVVGDLLVTPGSPVVLVTGNQSNIAGLMVSVAGVMQVSPLDNT